MLARFLRLPNADRRLLVRASMALVTAKLAVRAMSFISARKAVTSIQAIGGRPVAPPSPECIGWAVEREENAGDSKEVRLLAVLEPVQQIGGQLFGRQGWIRRIGDDAREREPVP